jgi:hypothetical protein
MFSAHALGSLRLLDDDHVALDQPTENDLRDGFAVGGPDLGEHWIGEQVVSTLGEGSPRLDLHTAVTH